MKFNKIYKLILEQLNQTQKLLVKDYALDRAQDLTFGPLFQNQRTYYQIQKIDAEIINIPFDIIKIMNITGYTIDNYRSGYAYKKSDIKKQKPIKINKILQKYLQDQPQEYLLLKKKVDQRLGTSIKNIKDLNLLLCITHNPYDIGGMSTGRNWTSCMDLQNGSQKTTPLKQIKYGGMCAYLIDQTDKEIQHPYARIAIKRLTSKEKGFIFLSEQQIYGDWKLAQQCHMNQYLQKILEKSNQLTKNNQNHFTRNDGKSYSDQDINNRYIEISNELILKILHNNNHGYIYRFVVDHIDKFTQQQLQLIIQNLNTDEYQYTTLNRLIFNRINNLQEFIQKYKDIINWQDLSAVKLNIQIIRKYKDKLDWLQLAYNDNIKWTYEFIKEFQEKIYFKEISYNILKTNDDRIFEQYKDKLNWQKISQQKLNEEFIQKYSDYLNLRQVCKNSYMSQKFIKKHIDLFANTAGCIKILLKFHKEKFSNELVQLLQNNIILENINSQQIISITNYQMSQIIASHQIQNNNSNMNNDFINLKKLLYDDQMKWYIFKLNNNIVACAACKENNIWNSLYINELFSFQKGFGAKLLLYLLNLNYNIIYLNSDWSQQESLNQYYRQSKFNLTEYVYKRDFYDVHYFYKNKTLNKRLLTKFIEEEFY